MIKDDIQNIVAISKFQAESIIKPVEKVLTVYKQFVCVLVLLNILLCGVFVYYIKTNAETTLAVTKTFTYSTNKVTKGYSNAQRSDVRVD